MLGSREAIARAKGEIIRDLPPSATAILNADDPLVTVMAGQTAAHVVRFGESSDARVRATDVRLDERARAQFTLVDTAADADAAASTASVQLQLSGRHQVSNALAAAAVGVVSGLSVQQIADALGLAVPDSRWRMEVSEAPGGCTVINDAYNANPESMRAALASLAAMAGGRRTWAVLGEMRELGDAAESAHAAVGSFAVKEGVARVVCVGDATRAMHRAASDEWARTVGANPDAGADEPVLVPDPAAAIALLTAQVGPEDIVLVKASRSIGLEVVAEALLEADMSPSSVLGADEGARA
jgi:UDP-N-acetylmuramoyl-tripeptide--D-alanyl-D-alanine ligase